MFTLRELIAMAQARTQQQWNHTAALLAMLANVHRDPKRSRAYSPSDFHPRPPARTQQPPAIPADISILKSVFVDRRTP